MYELIVIPMTAYPSFIDAGNGGSGASAYTSSAKYRPRHAETVRITLLGSLNQS